MKKQDAVANKTPLYLPHIRWLKPLLGKLLPHHCRLCDIEATDYLCQPCHANLPWLPLNVCTQCALPLTGHDPAFTSNTFTSNTFTSNKSTEQTSDKSSTEVESTSQICAECLKHAPHYDKTVCAFTYDFPLNDLIHTFKDRTEIHAGSYLTQQLISRLNREYSPQSLSQAPHTQFSFPQTIVAVPMHWQKMLHRGFNQAELIAHDITCKLAIPQISPIVKSTSTANQHQLNRRDRQRNLNTSFSLHKHADKLLKGIDHIALIDDVVTTGATTNTLAKILKGVGIKRVDVWALARTPTHF